MQSHYKIWMLYILSYIITVATSANTTLSSTTISCEVDYLGKIVFKIALPDEIKASELDEFYYWSEKTPKWMKVERCSILFGNIYKCDMPLLTHPDYSNSTFWFSLNATSTNPSSSSTYNITNFYFEGKNPAVKGENILPWITVKRFTECSESFGVKVLGLEAGTKDININWIEYPLSVDYQFMLNRTTIVVSNAETNNPIRINKDRKDICVRDQCKQKINVMSCSEYSICVETEFKQGALQVKCRKIEPYCLSPESQPSFRWQEGLLALFGGIIVLVCLGMSAFVFQRYRNSKDSYEKPDPVFPRLADNNCGPHDDVYYYPDLPLISEVDSVHDDI